LIGFPEFNDCSVEACGKVLGPPEDIGIERAQETFLKAGKHIVRTTQIKSEPGSK
jgi:hypothetical protein